MTVGVVDKKHKAEFPVLHFQKLVDHQPNYGYTRNWFKCMNKLKLNNSVQTPTNVSGTVLVAAASVRPRTCMCFALPHDSLTDRRQASLSYVNTLFKDVLLCFY